MAAAAVRALAAPLIASCRPHASCQHAKTGSAPRSSQIVPRLALPAAASSSLALAGFLAASLPAQALDSDAGVQMLEALDPLLLAGGAAALILPSALVFALTRKGYTGDLSAGDALKLLEQQGAFLVDIRSKQERAEAGAPSLKALRKSVPNVPFELEDEESTFLPDPEFAEKLTALKGVELDSTVVVIDKLGGIAPNAAKVLIKAGFKKVYAVKGGAEGVKGWKESDLPWERPRPSFKLDVRTLREALTASVEETKGLVPASLGVAAAAGASIVLLSEVEAAMQLLGSAALVQLLLKKFLFAEDRKKTIAEIKSFLDTKVAPTELVDDIKDIGAALLPDSPAAKKVEDVAEQVAAAFAEKEAPGNGAASSDAPVSQKSSTDFPPPPRPLSPYAMYPDLKPPTSPTPSPP